MKKLLLFCCGILISGVVSAQDIYIQSGKLIDTKNGKVLQEKTIIVSGNTIKSIENGFVEPASEADSLIDLRNMTVLPGLTDMHVHMESETNPGEYLEEFTSNESDIAFKSVGFAKSTLMAGFTTVRDLGGSGVNIALRNAINKN
jgi:imidazolonepropionase-like amidohydrolase